MDISEGLNFEAYSTINAQQNVMQQVGIAMLSNALDTAEMMGDLTSQMVSPEATRSMELSVNPHLGGSIDIMT